MTHILLIEDSAHVSDLVASELRELAFDVTTALDGNAGWLLLEEHDPDLLILDVMLPGMNGFEILRRLAEKGFDKPILLLTARGEEADRVVGLELGADDYVPKPFEPRELVARVQTVLRRRAPASPKATAADPNLLYFQGLRIDVATRTVQRNGEAVDLTGTEFDLLLLLARAPGKVFSRDDILNQLRGHEAELYTRAVDIVVSRLRKKLEPLDCIKTLRNAGYTLALAPLAASAGSAA